MMDALGRTIHVGDTVAYPNRHDSVTELCHGVVVKAREIGEPIRRVYRPTPSTETVATKYGPASLTVRKPNGRRVVVRHIERVVVCRRPEIPTE